MKIALCSPVHGGQSILKWQEFLIARGHEAIIFHKYDPTYIPDAVMYYGYVPCPIDEIKASMNARDTFAQSARLINSAHAWSTATDKIKCGMYFEDAGLPHPTLQPDTTEPVVVKPRFGSRGVDVTCDISFDQACHIRDRHDKDMIIQQYIAGRTCRLVTSSRRVLYAYEKVSDDPMASVSQGAQRVFFVPDTQLEALAVQAVNAVGGDLMGVDVIRSDRGDYVLEVNTGFAVYRVDTHVQDTLVDEFEWLAVQPPHSNEI